MKRPIKPSPAGDHSWTCGDKAFLKEFPTISEYMCDSLWEDGKPRECCDLKVQMHAEGCNIGLSDKNLKQSVYTSAEGLWEALGLMEEALAAGRGVWRRWKEYPKGK
jgi:hypothetical protein